MHTILNRLEQNPFDGIWLRRIIRFYPQDVIKIEENDSKFSLYFAVPEGAVDESDLAKIFGNTNADILYAFQVSPICPPSIQAEDFSEMVLDTESNIMVFYFQDRTPVSVRPDGVPVPSKNPIRRTPSKNPIRTPPKKGALRTPISSEDIAWLSKIGVTFE